MKSIPSIPRLAGAALLALPTILCAQTAPNTSAGPQAGSTGTQPTVVLDPFTVQSEKDYGYRATQAITATRIGAPIIETPLNISVVTRELLDDLNVTNDLEAFTYVSGVRADYNTPISSMAPGTAGSGLRIRGARTTFSYQDGFRQTGGFFMDGVDRIEVVKGPVGNFFGRTEPGGVVNFITKRPEFINRTTLSGWVGSDSFYKGLIDSQATLADGKLAYRLVASWRDSDDWQRYASWDEKYGLGSVTWRPSRELEVTFQAEWLDQYRTGGRANGLITHTDYWDAMKAGTLPKNPDGTFWSKLQWRQDTFERTGTDPRNYNNYVFPRGFSWDPKGPGSFDDIEKENFLVDIKWTPTTNWKNRLGVGFNQISTDWAWLLEQEIPRSPAVVAALADGGDINNPYVINSGIFTATFPFANGVAGNAAGRGATDIGTRQIQFDTTYDFEALGGKHMILANVEHSYNEGRSFPMQVNVNQFAIDGGIPARMTGLPNDPLLQQLSPAAQAAVLATHARLVAAGALTSSQRIPFGDAIFGAYPINVLTQEPPDFRRWILGRGTDTQSGSDSYDIGYAVSYRGKFLGDRLTLQGGVRRNIYKVVSAGIADGQESRSGGWNEFAANTPSVGILYIVRPNLNVYASYSETFIPRSGSVNEVIRNVVTGETLGGDANAPELGVGYEVGVKSNLREGMFAGTLSLFRLEPRDLIVPDGELIFPIIDVNQAAFNAGQTVPWVRQNGQPIGIGPQNVIANIPSINTNAGKQRFEGVEAELVVTHSRNWQSIVTFTEYFKSHWIVKDPSGVNVNRGGFYTGLNNLNDGRDAIPDKLQNVPERMFSFWTKYTIPSGALESLSFGVGGNYQSEEIHEARTNGTFEPYTTGDHWRFDARLGYETRLFDRPLSLNLSVTNLLNEEILSGPFGVNPLRQWRLMARYAF